MTKVCHMTDGHPPEDQRIFHKECVSLAKAGYDVYLVQQGKSYEKDGIHIVGFGRIAESRLKRMTQTAWRAYKTALAVDADIYHFHEPELIPWGLKLKRRGKKVIFDSHELYTDQIRHRPYLPPWAAALAAKAYGAYQRYALRRLDGVVFPCLRDGQHPLAGMCRHVITADNYPLLEELYNCYDEDIPKYERSIVHIGSLTRSRGITNLVKAAGRSNSTLYLGGTFSTPSYQAEVETMPEFSHVRYLGRLDRRQLLETLQRCQVGLSVPLTVGQYNRDDNFGTKVYECMSLGLPVVSARSAYKERIINQYRCGLCVDPEDPDDIATAIAYLLDHPEEARQMGQNGRRAIKEAFNWSMEEKHLLALYEEILNEK